MPTPVEDIKSRLDIVEFIQTYVRLQKAGMNFKANCPFHAEKTPSFFVSPSRQTWHCFGGCGEGGDVFKFLMKIEGLDFPEALKVLAARAGIELKREDPRIRSERNRLYDLCEEAAGIFELSLSRTQAARAYLQKRGVGEDSIKKFRLGFAPQSWDFLIKALAVKGFRKDEIERAGLAVKSGDGTSWYDRFRSRIIFPISDTNGRVIGFGGRIFHMDANTGRGAAQTEEAKYINTPQTLIYDKSRVLYGFNQAKETIRQKNCVVVVEGYMDCLMSQQAGVLNTIAVSGTALTQLQLATLKRICSTVLCSFDTDSAGESATRRSLAIAAQFEFARKIVAIPSGKDPADTVMENASAWRDAVEHAEPVIDFYFAKVFRENKASTVEGKKAISAVLLPLINELADEIEKSHWVSELAKRFGAEESSVWSELRKRSAAGSGAGAKIYSPVVEKEKPKSRRELLEARLLALAAFVDGTVRQNGLKDRKYIYTSDDNKELFAKLSAGTPDDELTAEYRARLADLRFQGEILASSTTDIAGEFMLSAREFEKECVREKLQALSSEIDRKERSGQGSEVDSLLKDFRQLSDMLKNTV